MHINLVLQDGAESCYQVALRPGEGFCPDPDEMRVLDGIDSRLKELLPPEEFEEVSARPSQMVSLHFIQNSMLYAQESMDRVFTSCCLQCIFYIATVYGQYVHQIYFYIYINKSNMIDLMEIYSTFIHMYCYLHAILFINMVTIT